jgi:tetratricopeptide (TPR) repeat protein
MGFVADEFGGNNSVNIVLMNESEIKRKLGVYITKITKEFNNNKRSRGRTRMISTRSLDYYYNDYEFEPLNDDVKFYVYMNRGLNKMSGDLWANAIEDFTKALNLKPKDIITNRYMAQCLNKLARHQEALNYIKVYAEADNTAESKDALAAAYIHLNDFDNAQKLYEELEEQYPESNIAMYGKAQLAYKMNKGYRSLLDKIYKKDEVWLRDKLKTDWEYRLPGNLGNDEMMWNAATAARYLGFERPFDLTRRAFNEEVPSYFDSEKGTIRFVKEELDRWVDILNRYKVLPDAYRVFEDRLNKEEIKKADLQKKVAKKNMLTDQENLIANRNELSDLSAQPDDIIIADLPVSERVSAPYKGMIPDDDDNYEEDNELDEKMERLMQIRKNFGIDRSKIFRKPVTSEEKPEPTPALDPPVVRKRGRPRKNEITGDRAENASETKPKRGRKKRTTAMGTGIAYGEPETSLNAGLAGLPNQPKKRGRKKKINQDTPLVVNAAPEIKKHRGRPRKTAF